MSIYDDPAAESADLHNVAETGNSFLDGVSDAFTKGVPLAVGSGLTSMYNTAVSLGNSLGGDFEKVDYDQQVKDYDDDLSRYYTEHHEGVDLGGFVATSFIPGLGGIKALKMIQGGFLGKSAAAGTGLFRNMEEAYLAKATSSIQAETNTLFKMLDGNKLAAMAAGTADQVLQAGAFETAVMLSMNQNPTIDKDDSGYFKTLVHNTPEIIGAALIGGGIGGGINALGIGGKIKSAIRARDKEDFPSLNIKELGLSDVDPGTAASLDFTWLKSREKYYTELADRGEINDRQLQNYKKTQQQKATELLTRIREDLTEDKDAELSKAVWNHLVGLDDSASEPAADIAVRLLGSATKISRITEGDSEVLGTKILYDDGYLSERHAKNILKRNKIAPQPINPTDGVALEEAKLEGHELYKDEAGNLRVVPGIKYASNLEKKISNEKHDFIVKIAGDQAGNIAENAYPVLGDLGKVTISDKNELLVNKVLYPVKQYDPLENTPLESSAAFLRERLLKEGSEEGDEIASISTDDLPRLEAAYIKGLDVEVTHADGTELGSLLDNPDILHEAKLEKRQELINAGHDFGRIARELNVSQEFAETGKGEYVLGRVEDHANPIHARMAYDTNQLPDKFYLRGTVDLMQRVQLAKQHNQKVAALILGEAFNDLPKTNGTMLGINTIPELGNFVKSADEFYGSFGELMQSVGKIADREFRKRSAEVMERISASHQAILRDEGLTRDFNLVVAKIRSSKEPLVLSEDGTALMPQSLTKLKPEEFDDAFEQALEEGTAFNLDKPEIAEYLKRTQEINATRADLFNHYFSAKGSATTYDPEIMYVPPINTRKYPYVAFVKEKAEGSFRPTSVITGSTAQDLEAKVRAVKQQFGDTLGVYTKDDLTNYFKMQGEYESGLMLGNSSVDVSLKKRGILSDFVPRTDDQILHDFVDWHIQSEQALVRNSIELNYGQEFAELRAMGQTFFEFQKSRFGRDLTDKEFAQMRKDNPYARYIDTALAVSNYTKYDSVWGKLNSAVEGLGQSMFKAWDSAFNKANKGEIDWVTANAEAEKLGLRPPFKDLLNEVVNPVIGDRKVVEPLVAKVNGALATTVLRLDFLNSLVNILGTPGLITAELASIRKNITNPDIVGKLSSLLTTGVPGTDIQMPSTMKLISQAFSNFVHDDGTLLKRYQNIGAVQSDLQLYRNLLDVSQLTPDILKTPAGIVKWSNDVVKKAADMGATLTGNNLSERMVRFVAADIMRQLGETAGIDTAETNAYINTFVNRVHGNYTASQRPHVFQGAVGQAIGLFQTFQFNVMQNMVRFIETGDKAAVASLLGLQNTLFGLQGNPAFYLLNSAIGNANREHKDLVTGAYATVGKDTADWLMYGLGSNALNVNLYNRGDLTPRYVTVLPTNIQDIPAVSLPAKFFGNVYDKIKAITQGGSVSQNILEGLAQNGVNRPLAGLAQLAQGYRTTAQGNLLVAYNEADTMLAAAKIFGGEELNHAIAIDQYYRQVAYKKKDAEKIADVGQALKSKIRSGEEITAEDTTNFMHSYSAAGGNVSTFNRFMIGQYKNASKSQLAVMKNATSSPYGKNLGSVMGAEDEEMLYRQSAAGMAESATSE